MLKRALTVFAAILIFAYSWLPSAHAEAAARKLRVAVFPFNDQSRMAADMRIASLLSSELATRDFIKIVPLRLIKRMLLEVEPVFIRTERTEKGNTAIPYWRIGSEVVETVAGKTNADFSVYGDIMWFDGKWVVAAYVSGTAGSDTRGFNASGDGEEEIPQALEELATGIAVWIRNGTIVEDVEAEARKLLGGIYTLPVAVSKVEGISLAYQNSLPVLAILLDLYLREPAVYKGRIEKTSSKIIDLYDPSNDEDTRYLLSRELDPFDILAGIYEEGRAWKKALAVRERALEVFPFHADEHRKKISGDKRKIQGMKRR